MAKVEKRVKADYKARAVEKTKEEKNGEMTEEQSPGFFQKLFAWVVIPLLFAIAILLVIAQFTNTNVFEKASEVLPIIDKEVDVSKTALDAEKRIAKLKAEIQEKDAQIEKLQNQLDEALAENEKQKAIQQQLKKEIEELQSSKEESKKDLKEIVKTYERMSAKAVAPIIVEMSDEQALEILSNMKPDTLSEVLSKMNPKDAARYTELLSRKQEGKTQS